MDGWELGVRVRTLSIEQGVPCYKIIFLCVYCCEGVFSITIDFCWVVLAFKKEVAMKISYIILLKSFFDSIGIYSFFLKMREKYMG